MTERQKSRRGNVVHVTVRGGPYRGAHREVVHRRAAKMLAALDLEGAELSIALIDDARMRELNRRFRKIDRPTDVLAFPMADGDSDPVGGDEPRLLGDVILSVDTARRQARQRRRPLRDELTTLLAHGLLHLLGHDHDRPRATREMSARCADLERAATRRR